jgi:hypothetical protein
MHWLLWQPIIPNVLNPVVATCIEDGQRLAVQGTRARVCAAMAAAVDLNSMHNYSSVCFDATMKLELERCAR